MFRKMIFGSVAMVAAACTFTTVTADEEIPAPSVLNAPAAPSESSVLLDPPSDTSHHHAVPGHAVPHHAIPHHPVPQHYPAPYQVHMSMHAGPAMCCKQPRIRYQNHPLMAMLMHKCKQGEAGKLVLEVPTGCCPAQVPVCVPLCCMNCAPTMVKKTGLFGRCVFVYNWPCGTTIRIAKLHTGDLVVHSYEI